MIKLKPCPFCGKVTARLHDSCCWIVCPSCDAEGPCGKDETDAINEWNKRHAVSKTTIKAIERATDEFWLSVCKRCDIIAESQSFRRSDLVELDEDIELLDALEAWMFWRKRR